MPGIIRHSLIVGVSLSSTGLAALGYGAEKSPGTSSVSSDRPITRLFFQDHPAARLQWSDVRSDGAGRLMISAPQLLPGFPTLDSGRQKLVQMAENAGCLLVGVRDDENGSFESGWILCDTGVDHEEHSDHVHWTYARPPAVWDSKLDKSQGNPAHLYLYDGSFYLANDRLNGYTRIDPALYFHDGGRLKSVAKPAFHRGGGNHITLAVVQNQVGYSCWIDGGGPNHGRVDVTRIGRQSNDVPAYSFHLPTGGIHGAIACEGKVFFAPSDGVCWVSADVQLKSKPEEVRIHSIPLGRQDDKPRRTGAFARYKSFVAFVTGREEKTSLVLLDAHAADPRPIEVPLRLRAGQKAVTPRIVSARDGRPAAFIFHDHDREADIADELTIVDLDPDLDGHCADAKVDRVITVGRSAVEGHYGHHDVDFDADGQWAFFTNPGDGTITVLSLITRTVTATHSVGGQPTALIARGGRANDD